MDVLFGPRLESRGVTFRLWAPGMKEGQLAVHLEQGGARLPMASCGEGWFEATTDQAGPGALYRFDVAGELLPDPASRFQPKGVHGPSEVIDHGAWRWHDQHWTGRPWQETVLCELHVGTFTEAGTFAGVIERLDYLAAVGVTAIELMPIAAFSGKRNWGYDGVLPYAPTENYGRPEDLQRLVDEAHRRGLMVFLDVVYNHFGPDGNYLHRYAPQFFTKAYQTPWGEAVAFESEQAVRRFAIENALYWLENFHIDGLRLDAVHAIFDSSPVHVLDELAEAVAAGPGRERQIHLVLENEKNQAHYLGRPEGGYRAQWNDDVHHAVRVIATGEGEGYYQDYQDDPVALLGKGLAEGFIYQGQCSPHSGKARGTPSAQLPPWCFVNFIQNHDQVGNRALGERFTTLAPRNRLEVLLAMVLLAPGIPMLFMGEEYGEQAPFLFFCDFHGELADAVREGRRREFAHFSAFADEAARERIPDPNAAATFKHSKLGWPSVAKDDTAWFMARYAHFLGVRRRFVVPWLKEARRGGWTLRGPGGGLVIHWPLGEGMLHTVTANLAEEPVAMLRPSGICVAAVGDVQGVGPGCAPVPELALGPWSAAWWQESCHG